MSIIQQSTQHRTQLYLPKSLYRKIKARSQQEDISMAQFIRNVLSSEFTTDPKKEDTAWDRLLQGSGIGKGPKDLSTRHDHYFSATDNI